MTHSLRGAEIIVDHLIAEKVPYLFGLCGHGIVGLMDAALDRRDRIRTVSVHNEQIAGFAADAYYRVARQPAATFTSCGPGSINIQMAIANAMFDSSALLAITGNVPTQQFNKGPFQELGHHHQADFVTAMRPYVKRSFQAPRADMLPGLMRQACTAMVAGRPGPVHLDVPFNVFEERVEAGIESPEVWRKGVDWRSAAPAQAVERALAMLLEAERPLILAGHGCLVGDAAQALARASRVLGIPVATTPQGKGVLDDQDPLYLGPTGRDGGYPGNRATRGCDVLLALGTRFGDRGTSSWADGVTHSAGTRIIHVDVDPSALARNYATELGVLADAGTFLDQLAREAQRHADLRPQRRAGWVAATAHWRALWRDALAPGQRSDEAPLHPGRVVADIAAVTPRQAVVLSDIGQHHSWMVQQWPVREGGLFLQSGGSATMGFGVGGAIGAQLAAQDRPVVAVVGDGGMLMHASAVATAVEYRLPIVWVVWNNSGYVSIRDLQKGFYGQDREFATRFRDNGVDGALHSTDYALLAQAMGAQGLRVERAADLGGQLERAIRSNRPTVLDVRVAADAPRLTAGAWDMPPIAGPRPSFDPDPLPQ
ncbi:thiamine pyrophosphate-binding protein [Acidovorax sp. MR-S7]|uniref:thiamine pyrophosphate-binding protein n=1 Tax=unclassified Acidovorax TaxID=2684926 RepID=UPI00035C7F41|nr:thiamine pyrophosphate-binding protein [Acidovorax sp. MR-S7]GAD23058.1 thiamine pyrophosphate-requiring enzyme [Acidovorax sp. MR-S7]